MIKEARLQWLGSSLDSTAVGWYLRSMAAVLLSVCCGDVAGLLESRLDDGAVAAEARWRRAVLALELSQPRLDGEEQS